MKEVDGRLLLRRWVETQCPIAAWLRKIVKGQARQLPLLAQRAHQTNRIFR